MKKIIVLLMFAAVVLICTAAGSAQSRTPKEYEFLNEARPYSESMKFLAKVYDPDMVWASSNSYVPPSEASAWVKIVADLKAVNAICKKYEPLPKSKYKERELASYARAWCDLAADPEATRQRAFLASVDNYVTNFIVGGDVSAEYEGFWDQTDSIPDRFQEMAYEPDVFRKKLTDQITAEYTKRGVTMPASYMDDYWRDYDKLIPKVKARAERTIASTSYHISDRKDAVLEKFVRAQYAKLPNAAKIQIIRVGFVSATWSSVDQLTWISTVDNVSLYRVHPGSHKFRRGWVVAKVENRPACQAREFTLRQDKGKPAIQVEYLSRGGRFIPCP